MLWRMVQDSEIWKNSRPETFKVAMYILLNANHTDNKWVTNDGQVIPIKRGQLPIGRIQASEDCCISEQTFRSCIKFLQRIGFLTVESTNRFSIITICKYDVYQTSNQQTNQQTNQQSTSSQPATNQQSTTLKECKNEKNDNNDIAEPKITWLTPYFDAWKLRYGGNPPVGPMASTLRPLEEEHGKDITLAAFKYYLASTKPEFTSFSKFSSTFGIWKNKKRSQESRI